MRQRWLSYNLYHLSHIMFSWGIYMFVLMTASFSCGYLIFMELSYPHCENNTTICRKEMIDMKNKIILLSMPLIFVLTTLFFFSSRKETQKKVYEKKDKFCRSKCINSNVMSVYIISLWLFPIFSQFFFIIISPIVIVSKNDTMVPYIVVLSINACIILFAHIIVLATDPGLCCYCRGENIYDGSRITSQLSGTSLLREIEFESITKYVNETN
jgi:hypothetical protein